ncbi:MAG TPA: hypothetical protein VFR23_03245 [Jiangellaceae bacterium]|nr:hypothetical protein [Jiangellaceae bacterium]
MRPVRRCCTHHHVVSRPLGAGERVRRPVRQRRHVRAEDDAGIGAADGIGDGAPALGDDPVRPVARRERAADFADSGRRAAATASITDLGTWVSAAPSR